MARPILFVRALAAAATRRGSAVGDLLSARRALWIARPATLRADVSSRPDRLGDGDPAIAAALASGATAAQPLSARPGEWSAAQLRFDWLDDALAGRRRDRETLLSRARTWLERPFAGGAIAWRVDVAGRRLGALATAWPTLRRFDPSDARLARVIAAHLDHLGRRGDAAPTPLGRLEAAAGLAVGALCCEDRGLEAARASAAVGRAAEALIDGDGGLASRNPADLARAVALLAWTAEALRRAGRAPDGRAAAALARAAPALRALLAVDGRLARLHGAGADGDALAAPAVARAAAETGFQGRGRRRDGAMGVARLAASRSLLLIDAAAPPDSAEAGASALALEFGVGRAPLFGAIGPGAAFGPSWALAARATAAHSAVEVAGASAARLEPDGIPARVFGRRFRAAPTVAFERASDEEGLWALGEHDGYFDRYGVAVARRLRLSHDGRDLRGEDTVACHDAAGRARFDRAARAGALPFCVRFHLAPGVAASARDDTAAVVATDGSRWRFRASGGRVSVEESVGLDDALLRRLPAVQIVVSAWARDHWGRVSWAFQAETPARPRAAAGAAVSEG